MKKIISVLSAACFFVVTIIPQGVSAVTVVHNFQTVQNIKKGNIAKEYLSNSLSEGLLVAGKSQKKQKQFLKYFINELKQKGYKDFEIIGFINAWANNHKEFFNIGNMEKIDVSELVLKNNKFSLKGWLLKLKDLIKEHISEFRKIFNYKYSGNNPNNLDEQTIKNMVSNIKFFPFIQLVLGFDLYSSFAMVFMQSGGYGLPLIALVMSLIAPVSFAVSGIGGIIGDNISKRTIIIVSVAIYSLGIFLFAFSGLSPILLLLSQILPTISVSLMSLTLSPFLYKSLDNLGEKDSFKEVYGSNLSLFWIVMSASILLGGLLVSLTNQFAVILLSATPSLLVSFGALFFTHNENLNIDNEPIMQKNLKTEKNRNIKKLIANFFVPVIKLSSDKQALSIVGVNIAVNNIFFVVMCFFLQPMLMAAGINVVFFAPIYFLGNVMQSLASHLIGKVGFVAENKMVRTIIFATCASICSLFAITGQPLFFIAIYAVMNFWQGTSSLSEVSLVYNTLDDNMRSEWLGFKSMFGMIISAITQISIGGLLAIGVSNNVIFTGAAIIIVGASFIIPKIINGRENKKFISDINIELDIKEMKLILVSA